MHIIQQQLINLAKQQDLGKMSLRQIARLIGQEGKPQIVKHHLLKLDKVGLMVVNFNEGVIKLVKKGYNKVPESRIYSLPVVGSANCGPATIFAEENIEQYLKISSSLLPRNKKDLYILIAEGDSMNKAVPNLGYPEKTIKSGDFVLVDSGHRNYRNGDIVVAVIDGMATIKRYVNDRANKRIILEPDSTEDYLPIFIHEDDDFIISGKVIDVVN